MLQPMIYDISTASHNVPQSKSYHGLPLNQNLLLELGILSSKILLRQIQSPPNKDLFDHSHNLSHSTLYPDVLKIKTIPIVLKQKFAKIPFVYYLQIHNLATLLPGHRSQNWIHKFVGK